MRNPTIQTIPDIHIGWVYDRRAQEWDIHYVTFAHNIPAHRHCSFLQEHTGQTQLSTWRTPWVPTGSGKTGPPALYGRIAVSCTSIRFGLDAPRFRRHALLREGCVPAGLAAFPYRR